MECKNCGKLIDKREEKKFCSGCGALIVEEKPVAKATTNERADNRKQQYVTQRGIELDVRTRFFYAIWLVGFFVLYFVLQFSIASFSLAFVAAIPLGALIAILFVIVISRLNQDIKQSLNDILGFVPAGGPGRSLLESLASMLPLMAKLPQDSSTTPENKNKRK